jgi:hypothetical protein
MSVINSLDAALKVFALSETTSYGVERRDVNLLKLLRKACDVMLGTTSRCAALETQQVIKQIHAFSSKSFVDFTYKGPT